MPDRPIQELVEAWRLTAQTLGLAISTYVQVVREVVSTHGPQIELAMKDFLKKIEELPPRAQTVYTMAAQRVWYLPLDLPLSAIPQLETLFKTATSSEIDSFLCEQLAELVPRIVEKATSLYPARRAVLTQALDAHTRGHFALSVLAFLAQAYGIKEEDLKLGPVPSTEGLDRLPQDSVAALLLAPLMAVDVIYLSQKQRPTRRQADPNLVQLNRHEVMHGLNSSYVYGTKENSVRAALLLEYMVEIGRHLP